MTSLPASTPPANKVLRATLRASAAITGVLAVVGSVAGYLYAGPAGLASALVGVVLTALFLGMTAVIILIAGRHEGKEKIHIFFGIVIVGLGVKLIVFVVAMLVLRSQPWVQPYVFFFAVVAAVLASLTTARVVMARTRVPYVGEVTLPASSEGADEQSGESSGT